MKHPLTAEGFGQLTGVDAATIERLGAYVALLERWQKRINLVARSTMSDPWRRHVLDSAQLAPLLPPRPPGSQPSIADLGSGAGFPGLVLAILGAGHVCLIDSDSRKCAFLREVVRATGASAHVETTRIESAAPMAVDVVTARACAPLPLLLGYAARHLAAGGLALLLKGRSAAAELTQAEKTWKMITTTISSVSDPSGVVIKAEAICPR